MKQIWKLLAAVLVSVIFAGCVSKNEMIKTSEKELESDPGNAAIHAKLAYQYYQESKKQNSIFTLKKAYDEAVEAHKLEPNSLQIKALVFEIGFPTMLVLNDQEIAEKLKSIFPELYAANANVAPPSYIDALFTKDKKDNTKQRKLLQKAISENPKFPSAYTLLSLSYVADKRYNLAIDTIERGLKTELNQEEFYRLLTNVYMSQTLDGEDKNQCTALDNKSTKNMIKSAKEVLKLNPNRNEMYGYLDFAYRRIAQNELAIHAAKTFYDKDKSNDILDNYMESMLIGGKKDEVLSSHHKKLGDYIMSYAYSSDQNWEKSVEHFDRYIKNSKTDNFYRYMMQALVNGKVYGKGIMQSRLKQLPQKVEINVWQQKLHAFLTGEIDKGTLETAADNACKKTEAYFVIGFDNLIDNNDVSAKYYFQKVVDQKNYSYVEYSLSKYYLQEGIKH